MQDNMTLKIDQDTRDLVFDESGELVLIFGDETVAQNVRNTLLAWKGEWPLNLEHGTDYERVLGKKNYELEPGEVDEVLREAIYQEEAVTQVDELTVSQDGRSLAVEFSGTLNDGQKITLEVNTK